MANLCAKCEYQLNGRSNLDTQACIGCLRAQRIVFQEQEIREELSDSVPSNLVIPLSQIRNNRVGGPQEARQVG